MKQHAQHDLNLLAGVAEGTEEFQIQESPPDVVGLAAERVLSFAKDALGRRMQMLAHADEGTGRLDTSSIDEEDEQLYRGVLFSCLMLERTLRISAPPKQFPRVVRAAAQEFLADLLLPQATDRQLG